MEQKGNDDEGILGFLIEDIQKELRRGKRLVYNLKIPLYILLIDKLYFIKSLTKFIKCYYKL